MTRVQRLFLSFFVEGNPVPKQSFRVSGKGGGFTAPRVKHWQNWIAMQAYNAMREINRVNDPIEEPLAVFLTFTLNHKRRVDLDNLSKCVLDGMNKIVYADDQQITDLNLKKFVNKKAKEAIIFGGFTGEVPGVHIIVYRFSHGKK